MKPILHVPIHFQDMESWTCKIKMHGNRESSATSVQDKQQSQKVAPRFFFLLATLWLSMGHVMAHKPSDSYLRVAHSEQELDVQWDISLRDLEFAIGLDADSDGVITWGEVLQRQSAISAYALSRLQVLVGGQQLTPGNVQMLVDEHTDGAYAVLKFGLELRVRPHPLKINYSLLFDVDPQHRGLLRWETAGRISTAVFSPENSSVELSLEGHPSSAFLDFVREGLWHIWLGFDHLAFLLALLLPSVLQRTKGKWVMASDFRSAFIPVAQIVTAFTIAHSLTLSLAALHVVELNSRIVESTIAASVVLAAANNLWPIFRGKGWWVAFGFGLVHGFGFANVLQDLHLAGSTLVLGLCGFNLGVELGQLACVLLFLPLAYLFRATWFYRAASLQFGSAAIGAVALVWMTERLFDLKLLPF